MSKHLDGLKKRHSDLKEKIAKKQRQLSVDPLSIIRLKKKKLLLKQQIESLQ